MPVSGGCWIRMQKGHFKEIVGDEPERALKSRRLVQMSIFACVPLTAVLILTLLDRDWPTALLLFVAVASVLFCLHLDRKGAIDLANVVLIWSLTITLTFIIWLNEGPYDEAVITYPSVLILAALILCGTRVHCDTRLGGALIVLEGRLEAVDLGRHDLGVRRLAEGGRERRAGRAGRRRAYLGRR